jgi:uncharacterized membrane protein
MSTGSPTPLGPPAEKSSTGLDANIAGLLCYFGGFITGIVFLLLERQSAFVRFHALQSTFAFIALFALQVVALLIPGLGRPLAWLLRVAGLVVWILMMVKAFRGERYKLPVVGDMAERQLAA